MELKKNCYIKQIIVLLVILFFTSTVYVVCSIAVTQKFDDVKSDYEFICTELIEISNINYDDEFEDIYNKIDELNELYQVRYHGFYDYNIYEDMSELYYGRLYIPDLDVNVGLYRGTNQYITDREDSANIFSLGKSFGTTIADHNNQEFSKLFNVSVGTKGYINNIHQQRIHLECTDVFEGYNTGSHIVNKSGIIVMGDDDYLMYTCNYSGGVLITLWTID